MNPAIKGTFEKAKVIVENSESCQVINFVDVSVILYSEIHRNTSKEERKAIRGLVDDRTIVIKKAKACG